jgi:hypothetical protein
LATTSSNLLKMTTYELILEDLRQEYPQNPTVLPPFYLNEQLPWEKIKALNRQHRRAKSLTNRMEMILTLWYIGEILEVQVSPAERTRCLKELSEYYAKLSRKIYYLFEALGVEQIARTQHITPTKVHTLSKRLHLQLVEEAMSIAGARLERGGSC